MDLDKAHAGLELDMLVAGEVFGAVVDGTRSSVDPVDENSWINTPAFSTDILAAWEVVKWMIADSWTWFDVSCYCGPWTATFQRRRKGTELFDWGVADADTAPLAICIAALRAVRAQKEHAND